MDDYSNMKVEILSENGLIKKSYDSPRVTLTVLALLAGLTPKEVSKMLEKTDEELQSLANQIGQEFLI